MGFLDKLFKSNFNEDEDDDYEEEEAEETETEDTVDDESIAPIHEVASTPKATAPKATAAKPQPAAAKAPSSATAAPTASKVKIDGASLELKLVKPENFTVVSQIADHLLNRRTVVLNLESTSKEDRRRIIDFLSGVAYSIDGHLSKVAVNTFLIVPANVSVSGVSFEEAQPEGEEPRRVADIIDD